MAPVPNRVTLPAHSASSHSTSSFTTEHRAPHRVKGRAVLNDKGGGEARKGVCQRQWARKMESTAQRKPQGVTVGSQLKKLRREL